MLKLYAKPDALVKRITVLYERRRALVKEAEAIEAEEKALLDQAPTLFTKHKITNCVLASGHKIVLGTKPIATITDWPALLHDVAEHADDERYLSVIHKRVSPTALEALSFEKLYANGVLLDFRKVATFSAPRKKKE